MLITREPIDLPGFFTQSPDPECGASVFFAGIVRNHHDGRKVQRLFYDCYAPLAEKEMQRIMDEVQSAFPVSRIRAIHRVGWLEVGEVAILIEASSAHRHEAFGACRAAIEKIKKTVPIWKKEFYEDGTSQWVLCAGAGMAAGRVLRA